MTTYNIIATSAMGLESVVAKEVRKLGYTCQVENGKITYVGDELAIARSNLWLRAADRVKIVIGSFFATTFDQLFEGTKALPWEQFLTKDAQFPVTGKSVKSTLYSVPDCQAIVKKAIVERLKEKYKINGWLVEKDPKVPIEVSILKDQVTLTIDTSGSGLHKRGYRVDQGDAPLKETLAAAVVLLTNWTPDRPFIDPFSGSGTIPIEAALIGQNIAPGFNRDFLSETWLWMPKNVWVEARTEAEDLAEYDRKLDIVGSDIDHRMVKIAKENALEAGLSHIVHFKQMQATDFSTKREYGVIVTNPPYGERIGEKKSVQKMYQQLGVTLSKFPTWSFYILTAEEQFEKFFGKKATKKRKLYNGPMKTDYYQFWGPRKNGRKDQNVPD
ncbi:THUMP domain-containing class I SAM-dependent RNA methyltransferase [Fervidibacillus halotolerans]|uniref:Class I SAM-dependent RNA methyltransferase n=1 Tax=Fervidibacillus halotolerans TaxID=2980027 RepID=A0A9E8M2E0_9BACI|nr:class I SAM-dependent RNA methyltransferase [Fervidibacillus halotolerans]WAA13256.1 class I SAM-dependent RNA methyltransferase [Fervidibacillus halotolerans]